MENRIQTWSIIKNGKRVPYAGNVKSFAKYQDEVKTEKLIQKAYTDHLLQQLAEARQAPLKEDKGVKEAINELKEMVTPVSKFFSKEVSEPVKRISAKERKILEAAEYERKMDLKAIAYLNKKGA